MTWHDAMVGGADQLIMKTNSPADGAQATTYIARPTSGSLMWDLVAKNLTVIACVEFQPTPKQAVGQ